MDIYSILMDNLKGEGSERMWCVTKILSDSVDEFMPEKQRDALLHKVYYSVNGGHFNREFADLVMSKMYYYDDSKTKCYAPYWTESEIMPLYNAVRSRIPAYNLYDFEVTMNMVKSDNHAKLKKWFPDATDREMLNKIIEEAVNYLDDEDNPYGTEKIWKYLNS